MGNIVWVDYLLETQRQHVYKAIVKSIVERTTEVMRVQPEMQMVPFQLIPVAGDGRCAWRALLAASDVDAFQRVPRTLHVYCIYIYIEIEVFAQLECVHIRIL